MKTQVKLAGAAGMLMALFIIGVMLLAFAGVAISIYGLYLAFSASILLGLLALLVEPSPLIFGLIMLFTGTNLPEKIVQWFSSL